LAQLSVSDIKPNAYNNYHIAPRTYPPELLTFS